MQHKLYSVQTLSIFIALVLRLQQMRPTGNFLVFMLLCFFVLTIQVSSLTRFSTTRSTAQLTRLPIQNFTKIQLKSLPSYVYHGTVDIQITDGQQQSIDFFVHFVNENSCDWQKCFIGWVSNYTQKDEETTFGYPNGKLQNYPVFQFNTNSQQDFEILRSGKIQQIWAQIIELACQKLNPQLVQNSSLKSASHKLKNGEYLSHDQNSPKYIFQSQQQVLQTKTLQTASDTQNLKNVLFTPDYNLKLNDVSKTFAAFKTSPTFIVLSVQKGDFQALSTKNLKLQNTQAKNSAFGQQIILNQKFQVKQRLMNYDVSLESDAQKTQEGQEIPDFAGRILIGLNLIQSKNVLSQTVNDIKSKLAQMVTLKGLKNSNLFGLKDIQKRRQSFGVNFASQNTINLDNLSIVNSDGSNATISNIPLSGVTFAKLTKSLTPASFTTLSSSSDLQSVQIIEIYNYTKNLFSKTIFGKQFKVSVQVKCHLTTSSSQTIQCTGYMKYEMFGLFKSITIFNFAKTVRSNWSQSKQFKGNWGSSFYIPLPPPVSFLGLNFAFQVGFVIDLSLSSNTYNGPPYKAVVCAVAATSVTAGASAAIRAVVIEGGVYISGTLVKLRTDPTLSLTYYESPKKILAKTQWYFQIYSFQYQWGFFYRVWKFWSGWSGKRIIKKWTINGLYSKYTIINRSWNIYY